MDVKFSVSLTLLWLYYIIIIFTFQGGGFPKVTITIKKRMCLFSYLHNLITEEAKAGHFLLLIFLFVDFKLSGVAKITKTVFFDYFKISCFKEVSHTSSKHRMGMRYLFCAAVLQPFPQLTPSCSNKCCLVEWTSINVLI